MNRLGVRLRGFRVAFALGVGTMIAAGIFSLPGTVVYRIGSSAVAPIVIAKAGGFRGRVDEALFAPYRYLRKHV